MSHVKRRNKAKKALRRLRTIAGALLRELQKKLPEAIRKRATDDFQLYEKGLSQKPKDKHKIYSLHEAGIYCVGKAKDHKPYEYGRKASVVATVNSQVIVSVESHDEHTHDSKTLEAALAISNRMREKAIKCVVVDRGYRGAKQQVAIDVLLPSSPLKRDNTYQRQKKRRFCRKRAAIEPIIGHLKQDYRLQRNWLKGSQGDAINLLMAACAWNLRKWVVAFFFSKNMATYGYFF